MRAYLLGKSAEMSALSALLSLLAENKEHNPLLLHLAAAWREKRKQRRRKRRKHSSGMNATTLLSFPEFISSCAFCEQIDRKNNCFDVG